MTTAADKIAERRDADGAAPASVPTVPPVPAPAPRSSVSSGPVKSPPAWSGKKGPSTDSMSFRAWLWLQKNEKTEFFMLARLVLSGGPENMWTNKPISAAGVLADIETYFTSGYPGIYPEHVELARKAIDSYDEMRGSAKVMLERRMESSRRATKTVLTAEREALHDSIDRGPELLDPTAGKSTEIVLGSVGAMGLPRVQCTYVKGSGFKCNRLGVVGSTRCQIHGGELLDPEEVRGFLRAGSAKLLAMSETALDVLADLMTNSVQDAVRLKAAEMILDRSGFRAGVEVTVTDNGDGSRSPAEIIQERLQKLAENADYAPPVITSKIVSSSDATDVIDGEVID